MTEPVKYVLRILALGQFPEVSIDQEAFISLRGSRNALSDGLAIEEKYEFVISNYLELERELFDHSADSMVRQATKYHDFFQIRVGFNRRLVNLLTAARLYVDQVGSHVRRIMNDSAESQESVKSLLRSEYDKELDYRFMEALRNYVQHRGTPVHWFSVSQSVQEEDDIRWVRYSTELASLRAELSEDKEFKKQVLDELPERIDLRMAVRVYVECLSRVHCATRRMVSPRLDQCRALIEGARGSYKEVHPDHFVGLHALKVDGGTVAEAVPLLLDWDDCRVGLTERNAELVNLRRRFVSGRLKPSKNRDHQ